MLNRRSLRIKGMQSIFAYQMARQADYQVCKKEAQDNFLPDMTTMKEQDKDALRRDRAEAGKCFDIYHLEGIEAIDKEVKPEIVQAIKNSYINFQNRVAGNHTSLKKRMIAGITSIYDDYIRSLFLVVEFQQIIDYEKCRKNISHNNFAKNIVINKIKTTETLEVERRRRNLSWDTNLVKTWYQEYIKPTAFFAAYDSKPTTDLSDDFLFVQQVFKTIIFKNKYINDYFEILDLWWEENKPIIKSMVLKSLKSIESEQSDMLIMKLSQNWEEDLSFLKELYDLSIDKEATYESWIKPKSKNWKIDRVAVTDKIILEMAIAEMTHFPSIPVKVTINEYIELSKLYSTPKSKLFVNGLLDALSVDLKAKGQIKKSGRGLLDNK